MSSRRLPLVADRDRISAARFAADRAFHKVFARVRRKRWSHWIDSKGGIISERDSGVFGGARDRSSAQ